MDEKDEANYYKRFVNLIKQHPALYIWGETTTTDIEDRNAMWLGIAKEMVLNFDSFTTVQKRKAVLNMKQKWRSMRNKEKYYRNKGTIFEHAHLLDFLHKFPKKVPTKQPKYQILSSKETENNDQKSEFIWTDSNSKPITFLKSNYFDESYWCPVMNKCNSESSTLSSLLEDDGINVDELIQHVFKRKSLWHKYDAEYSDLVLRHNLWMEITELMYGNLISDVEKYQYKDLIIRKWISVCDDSEKTYANKLMFLNETLQQPKKTNKSQHGHMLMKGGYNKKQFLQCIKKHPEVWDYRNGRQNSYKRGWCEIGAELFANWNTYSIEDKESICHSMRVRWIKIYAYQRRHLMNPKKRIVYNPQSLSFINEYIKKNPYPFKSSNNTKNDGIQFKCDYQGDDCSDGGNDKDLGDINESQDEIDIKDNNIDQEYNNIDQGNNDVIIQIIINGENETIVNPTLSFDELKLIDLVKERPELWDETLFCENNLRGKYWNDIAAILFTNWELFTEKQQILAVNKIRTKWKHFSSSYDKEKLEKMIKIASKLKFLPNCNKTNDTAISQQEIYTELIPPTVDNLKLIELIKERPNIWSSTKYGPTRKTRKDWFEIGALVIDGWNCLSDGQQDLQVNEIIEQWKTLRVLYREHMISQALQCLEGDYVENMMKYFKAQQSKPIESMQNTFQNKFLEHATRVGDIESNDDFDIADSSDEGKLYDDNSASNFEFIATEFKL